MSIRQLEQDLFLANKTIHELQHTRDLLLQRLKEKDQELQGWHERHAKEWRMKTGYLLPEDQPTKGST